MKIFLSTPSARRATLAFSGYAPPTTISIHAPREEGDPLPNEIYVLDAEFLSTLSARRATVFQHLHRP